MFPVKDVNTNVITALCGNLYHFKESVNTLAKQDLSQGQESSPDSTLPIT